MSTKITTLKFPERIRKIITRPISEQVIQQRDAGRGTTLDYVSGAFVIDTLNLAFGEAGWDFMPQEKWLEQAQPKFNQYSKVPDSEKVWHNGKQGAWENQQPILHVYGILTVRFIDDNGNLIEVRKTGFGSKGLNGGQSEQEHIYKSAATDALKKAASQLGIGGQLYRSADEQTLFERLSFANNWSEEDYQANKVSVDYIIDTMEMYGFGTVGMKDYVQAFLSDTMATFNNITPENIVDFVTYLKSLFNQGE